MKRWTLLVLLVVIGLTNLIRAGMAFRMNALFNTLQVTSLFPLGLLFALSGICFFILAFVCSRNKHRCPAFHIILGYEIILWIVRLLTYRSTFSRSLWMRDVLFSFIFLGIVFFLTHKPRQTDEKLL